MRWLSDSVETLIAQENELDGTNKNNDKGNTHEVVIVGSGYGGAVSARRLAEKGYEVLVLERGEEYLPGEFPNDIAKLPEHVRVERWNADDPVGYDSSLFDVRLGETAGVLVGNALGGTSQINANVAIQPDDRVFTKPAWPEPIADAVRTGNLTRYFDLARWELEIEKFQGVCVGQNGQPVWPRKYQALQSLSEAQSATLASGLSITFEPAPVTVNLTGPKPNHLPDVPAQRCIGCGDCFTGCNYAAKNTLTTNYLAKAKKAGAKLYTGVTVLKIERDTAHDRWKLCFVRTAERSTLRKRQDGSPDLIYHLYATAVILAAGTLGTTEILGRSNALRLSEKLGQQFSGNGDYIAFGYMQRDQVNGVGHGSRAWTPSEASLVGPTITGMIRIDDSKDVTQSTLIQEGAVPGAIARIFHELVTTAATAAQLFEKSFRGDDSKHPTVDPSTLQPPGLTHTQTLLAMGHDGAKGRLCFDNISDRLQIQWNDLKNEKVYALHDERMRCIEALGAIYIANPAWRPLPDRISSTLSGPALGNGMFTVHPLGGCPMGDDIARGVVSDIGAVYRGNGAPGETYPGLYVLDGSIIPCALGVNPLLTITALAERAIDEILKRGLLPRRATAPGTLLPSYPFDKLPAAPYANPYGDEVALQMTEVLRGDLLLRGEEKPRKASLLLHLPVADLRQFFEDPSHTIEILGSRGDDKERLAAKLRIGKADTTQTFDAPTEFEFEVVSGRVQIFTRHAPRRCHWLDELLRVFLTWLIERPWNEIKDKIRDMFTRIICRRKNEGDTPAISALVKVGWQLFKHATENRIFDYQVTLERDGEEFFLQGYKHFAYAASWSALRRHLYCTICYWLKRMVRAVKSVARRVSDRHLLHLIKMWLIAPVEEDNGKGGKRRTTEAKDRGRGVPQIKRPYLQRRNLWVSLGQLDVNLYDGKHAHYASGSLNLDMVDMTRRHAPQLRLKRDATSALLAFGGYPSWFARAILKTRLSDFRLPEYPRYVPKELSPSGIPQRLPKSTEDPPTPWPRFPKLRCDNPGGVAPEEYVRLYVQRSAEDTTTLEVRLTRYKRPRGEPPEIGNTATLEVFQAKSIMLINGFAQPTLPFVAQEIKPNLAEYFYDQGYEVWLFDYRTSTILDASKESCTMDDIARFDIPAAVNQIVDTLKHELNLLDKKLQIYVFAHCVGAATMAMSMLAGHLVYPPEPGGRDVSKIAGVIFSQMQAFLIGSATGQMRLQISLLLRDVAGVKLLRLSAAEREPTTFETLLDRLYATIPVSDEERCPHENALFRDRPDITTCKRLTGTLSRLLKHDQLAEETHQRLGVYFGRANIRLFAHGAKCVEYERLVNADGENVYVTDANIGQHFRLPIALLHGRENVLFDFESADRTCEQLCRVHGTEIAEAYYERINAEGYAHFDCTIGKNAKTHIFEKLGSFLQKAWERNRLGPPSTTVHAHGWRSHAQVPVTGPIIGWARTENNQRRVRLWIQVDEYEADLAACAITIIRAPGHPQIHQVDCWPILRIALRDNNGRTIDAPFGGTVPQGVAYVAVAVADLCWDENDRAPQEGFDIDMVSVHEFPYASDEKREPSPHEPEDPTRIDPPLTSEDPDRNDPAIIAWPRKHHILTPLHPVTPSSMGATTSGAMTSSSASVPSDPPRVAVAKINAYLRDLVNVPVVPIPKLRISAKQAETLIATLKDRVCKKRKTALSPNPPTLSRKRRDLPSDKDWTIHLKPQTLTGPTPRGTLRFFAACCRAPGMAFEAVRNDAALRTLNDMLEQDAGHRDFMLMLGDQIYADATAGIFDPASPIEKLHLRYEHAFATTEFRRLARQLPLYMVPDDHEISDNWSCDELWEGELARRLFFTAAASFAAYQWAHSPRNIYAPGFNYKFEVGGYHFLVLDTRTQRSRHETVEPVVLTDQQFDELETWLTSHRKDDPIPKFVATGSVFAPGVWQSDTPPNSDRTADNWQLAREQRNRVLQLIEKHAVRNVVFISGDYHCSATAELALNKNGLKAYAIISPALYAPYLYANVAAHEVMKTERINFGTGTATVTAEALDGNGFMDIRINNEGSNAWRLEVNTYNWRFEDQDPEYHRITRHFLM